jgi:hypothetical protein
MSHPRRKVFRAVTFLVSTFVILFHSSPTQSAAAEVTGIPPAGNVSCSLTDDGVSFGVSMTITNSIIVTDWSYDWSIRKFVSGDPQFASNYNAPVLFRNTIGSGTVVTYQDLLNLASGDSAALLMVSVAVKNAGISNASGSGCYFDLPTVLKNKKNVEVPSNLGAQADAKAVETLADELLLEASRVDSISSTLNALDSYVTELGNRVSAAIALLKSQIASLTDLVIKIQMKVRK